MINSYGKVVELKNYLEILQDDGRTISKKQDEAVVRLINECFKQLDRRAK